MPAPAVIAELVLNAIKERLDLITGGPEYNTNPSKKIGTPRDAVPEGSGEAVYLVHVGSETIHSEAMGRHVEHATYQIWCMSRHTTESQKRAIRLVRDVQKAVRSGFPALEAAGANAGVALESYTRDGEAEDKTGATVYAFLLTADWIIDAAA